MKNMNSTEQVIDDSTKLKLLTSAEEQGHTIIHCKYVSPHIYINGGWVNIWPITYLDNDSESLRLELLQVVNIPLAPNKHYFKKPGEILHFSLIFGRVPDHWSSFNMQEIAGNSLGFGYSGIERNKIGVYNIRIC